ncbi:MAG: hypothetical protein GX491_03975 [Chloroflexi bacterium]|nr:hypothetical protein [Chloroflexota bacterium]
MDQTRLPSWATPTMREEYQARLDSGERIAGLAREAGISVSTMRWRLKRLGVNLEEKAKRDGRYLDGGRAKYQVPVFLGSLEVEEKLWDIAHDHGVDVSPYYGSVGKLEALLRALVPQYSNCQIAKILDVSETSVRKWCKKFGIQTRGPGEWAKIRAKKALNPHE